VLVLTRKLNESIVIDGVITVTVLEIGKNGTVRLGINAPRHHQVYRQELFLEIQAENRTAAAAPADAAVILRQLFQGPPAGALPAGALPADDQPADDQPAGP
jgi:carbon storage regulator